ncbi:hypothetical protein J6G99_07060 [bacterium]|nr:hypothetical protein [bacterium]
MRKILLLVTLFMVLQIQANSAVSVDKTITEEYLRNNGYSKQVYDTVNVSRARALGEAYYSSEEIKYMKSNKAKKFWRKLYQYLDPAAEDYSFYHHDTLPSPSYTDL